MAAPPGAADGRTPSGDWSAAPLAPHTTLGLGGPADRLVTVDRDWEAVELLRASAVAGTPVAILGGGSNVVVADEGFPGTVLRMAIRGTTMRRARQLAAPGAGVEVTAAAGEPWDAFVAWTVAEGWAGLECLAGIPGTVGATPIQNVGAYGQEVADTLRSVRVVDRLRGEVRSLPARELAFGYRSSRLRRDPDRYLVLGVTFGLVAGGPATVRYGELARALGVAVDGDPSALAGPRPPLAAVRAAVLDLRRSKSMVLDVPDDPNRRSVGSFFVNPVVGVAEAREAERRARSRGLLAADEQLPSYPAVAGVDAPTAPPPVKLAAAWLIERSGFGKGFRRGAVGISSRHALALVHHGGGTTGELLALAAEIQAAVHQCFGVLLRPEPVPLGPPGFPDGVAAGLFAPSR